MDQFQELKRRSVTVCAPINIALIKYWGKRAGDVILPLNDSISVNVDALCARSTVEAVYGDEAEDGVSLNGQQRPVDPQTRYYGFFQRLRAILKSRDPSTDSSKWHFHVTSETNFPVSAGLASSAAGFSAMAYGVGQIFGFDHRTMSDLARVGSGSACRGVFGGFVHWRAGAQPDGLDCRCEVLAPPDHWPQLMAVVVVASSVTKPCSSTEGMRKSVETSPFLRYRVEHLVPAYVEQMKVAIQRRDFAKFAELTMRDSNQLHAVCMDTYPPLMYLSDTSRQLMLLVHAFNQLHSATRVAYTFDAGSNCCLIMSEDFVSEFLSYLCYYFPNYVEKKFIRGILPMVDCTMLSHCQLPGFTPLPNSVEYVVVTRLGASPTVLL